MSNNTEGMGWGERGKEGGVTIIGCEKSKTGYQQEIMVIKTANYSAR